MTQTDRVRTLVRHAKAVATPSTSLDKISASLAIESPIVVMGASHRTGSTLVHRLLSSHPDVFIWGEHAGQVEPLLGAWNGIREWEDRIGGHGRSDFAEWGIDSFMSNLTPNEAIIDDAFRLAVYRLFGADLNQARVPKWGFKEVRYSDKFIDKFVRLFPKARIIFVLRHVDGVARSLATWETSEDIEWETDWTHASIRQWAETTSQVLSADRPEILVVRLEDLSESTTEVDRIERHLGLKMGSIDRNILNVRVHGPTASGRQNRSTITSANLRPGIRSLLDSVKVRETLRQAQYEIKDRRLGDVC